MITAMNHQTRIALALALTKASLKNDLQSAKRHFAGIFRCFRIYCTVVKLFVHLKKGERPIVSLMSWMVVMVFTLEPRVGCDPTLSRRTHAQPAHTRSAGAHTQRPL